MTPVKMIRTLAAALFAVIAFTAQADAACFQWSKTASSNANADATINWAEGMAPSAVNDSARAMMARLAECRDDWSGALTTGGTSTAYTVTTNQNLSAATPPDGFRLVLRMNATNGASPTLAADGGTAYPIRTSTGTAIGTGYMVAGGVYAFSFNSSTSAWMVNSFFNIPVNLDLIGTTQGSVLYRGASAWTALTPGTAGHVLTSGGSGANPSWAAVAVPKITPQGYLTPTSNTPRILSDASAATTLYYTPDTGNMIPIYDGTAWANTEFSQLTLTLHSSQAADTIYDVCIFNDSGTIRAGFTPAWQVSTAGSGSRGTGAGTPQLTRVGGVYVNAVAMTVNNGATTYSVSANRCTYVATVLIDGSAGQTSAHVTYGQNRRWGIWNAYNRKPIAIKMGDSTGNWAYASSTVRQSRGSSSNTVSIVQGLAEETVKINFAQNIDVPAVSNNAGKIGIGINSTTAATGYSSDNSVNGADRSFNSGRASTTLVPALGRTNINSLEWTPSGGNTSNFYGTEASMLLTVEYGG